MSAVTVNPELTNALKRLRLGGLLPTLAERLALCEAQSLPYQDVLLLLLSAITLLEHVSSLLIRILAFTSLK